MDEGFDVDELPGPSSRPMAKTVTGAQKVLRGKSASNIPLLSVSASRPNKSKTSMPNISVPPQDHRYRAAPFYRTPTRVERLAAPPLPCSSGEILFTPNWTSDPVITDRINRAHVYNVGPGPVWELIEDRSWWKESITGRADEGSETCRRPRVYESLNVSPNFDVIDRK